MPGNQVDRFLMQRGNRKRAQIVHPLSKGLLGGKLRKAQRPAEEFLVAIGLDVGIVALAQAQQPDHRQQHVAVRQFGPLAFAQADVVESLAKWRLLKQGSGQARVRNEDFVGVRDDEFQGFRCLTIRLNSSCSSSLTTSAGKQGRLCVSA